MRLLFTAILYLNILVSLISFIFACILLKRSKGNAIYFNFGMAVLFLGTWAAEIFLLFFKGGILLANLSYLFGIWILHYFLLFTYLYPVASPKLRYKFIIFYFFTLLVSTSIFIPKLYTTKAVVDFLEYLEVEQNRSQKTIANYHHYLTRLTDYAGEIKDNPILLNEIKLQIQFYESRKDKLINQLQTHTDKINHPMHLYKYESHQLSEKIIEVERTALENLWKEDKINLSIKVKLEKQLDLRADQIEGRW